MSERIDLSKGRIQDKAIKVYPPLLLFRIAVEPTAKVGAVETVAVVVQACFNIEVLRGEAMME